MYLNKKKTTQIIDSCHTYPHRMLYAFAQKQKTSKSASHLNITYIVGGRCSLDGEKVRVCLW